MKEEEQGNFFSTIIVLFLIFASLWSVMSYVRTKTVVEIYKTVSEMKVIVEHQ